MKPVAQSPFAALDPREQKEQWICWQAAHTPREDDRSEPLPELTLPRCEQPRAVPPAPPAHHSQYDAVIRRMKRARASACEDRRC